MDGVYLLNKVRSYLADNETDTVKGEFWKDAEIQLALNAAQDIFVNTCIKLNIVYLLRNLTVTTAWDTTPNPKTLPQDYVHILSGRVGATDDNSVLRTARIFVGGAGFDFMYSMDCVAILNSQIWYKSKGADTHGHITYLRRPTAIDVTTTFNSDFYDDIYGDVIVNHAVVLLGMKEIQTSREFRLNNRGIYNYIQMPKRITNYLTEADKARIKVAETQQNQNQSNG